MEEQKGGRGGRADVYRRGGRDHVGGGGCQGQTMGRGRALQARPASPPLPRAATVSLLTGTWVRGLSGKGARTAGNGPGCGRGTPATPRSRSRTTAPRSPRGRGPRGRPGTACLRASRH